VGLLRVEMTGFALLARQPGEADCLCVIVSRVCSNSEFVRAQAHRPDQETPLSLVKVSHLFTAITWVRPLMRQTINEYTLIEYFVKSKRNWNWWPYFSDHYHLYLACHS
jgi:hypothetical protein